MRFFRILHILSLDVAFGAAAFSLVIANQWNTVLPYSVPLMLGLTVWLIYTFDHLKDAREIPYNKLTARRRFHYTYFRQLVSASIFVLLLCVGLLFTLDSSVLLYGAALAGLVMAYFLVLHYLKLKFVYHKELIIALLYACGVGIGPFTYATFHPVFIVHFVQIFLVALSNLWLFSWFDVENDVEEGFIGIMNYLGEGKGKNAILILVIAELCLASIMYFEVGFQRFEILVLSMLILLIIPLLQRQFWSHHLRYRIIGDGTFLICFLFLL